MPVGELYALLTLHAEQFNKGLSDAERSSKGFGSSVGSAFAGVAKAVLGIGIAVTAAAIGIAAKGLDMAEVLSRAQLLIAAAYGKSAQAVEDWAKRNQVALGVTETDLDKSMSAWGVYAKGIGLSTDQAAAAGEALSTRAAQIAAVTGQSYDEVFGALQKGVEGATKGLKTYGVAIDANAVKLEAEKLGLYSGKGAIDLHAKAVATEQLVLAQTTPYVTAFGKAHEDAGFSVKQIGVIFDDTMVGIGQAVAPIAAKVMPELVAGVQAASDWFLKALPTIIAIFEQVFGAIGDGVSWIVTNVLPLFEKAFGFITGTIMPAVSSAFNGLSAKGGPIETVGNAFNWITTTVIPALGAIFDWIVKNVLPPVQSIFETWEQNILPILTEAFGTVVSIVQDNWPTISAIVGKVASAVKTAFDIIAAVYKVVAPLLKDVADVLFPAIKVAAGVLLTAINVAFTAIGVVWQTAATVASTVVGVIGGAWTGLTTVIGKVWSGITGTIKGAVNAIIGIINGVIGGIDSIQLHIDIKPPIGPEIKFDWNGVGLGKLGYLASGTKNWPGGWAVLGEQGPELAKLPGGTQVFPAGQTAAMLGGRGSSPLIGHQTIYGVQPDEVERQTRRAIRRASLELQLSGGRL